MTTRLLRLSDGSLSTLADLAPYSTGYANDCVVDQAGRVYVGDFGFDLSDVPHAGRP
jgi:sugar lactone lactonase YvrE